MRKYKIQAKLKQLTYNTASLNPILVNGHSSLSQIGQLHPPLLQIEKM